MKKSKKFKILALSFGLLLAGSASAKVQDVELIADNVEKNGFLTTASGNVTVYSQDYFITADRATYDEQNGIIELFGNVNAMRGSSETTRAEYVKIDLKNDKQEADVNFMMDKDSELWMQNDASCSDSEYYRVEGSSVSSCNVTDPDWRIKFSSGMLNKESKFLHLFNPRFYVGDVPVLYLPYFGFPTDRTRRTGLLPPEAGYISKEGIYYKQPIYFAPYDSWDFQLDPQVRSRRGFGAYGTFRFTESPYSYGEIRGGMFDNFSRAQKRLEYKNERHHGFEVQYDRSKLATYLLDGDLRENLWIDFTQLNDLEYYDLKEKGGLSDDADNSLVTSRLNYYLTGDEHYFGAYGRYYIDTSKLNADNTFRNKDTVQELPTLQYHKFSNDLGLPNLLYSLDAKARNFTRRQGVTAKQYEFDAPLSFSTPFLSEYLNFVFTERLYMSATSWKDKFYYRDGSLREDKNTFYANQYSELSIYSDVARAYDSLFHSMSWGADIVIPGWQKGKIDKRLLKYHQYKHDLDRGALNRSKLGDLQDSLYYEDDFLSELSDEYTHENAALKMSQYFYDEDGRKFLHHSVKQRYDFDDHEFDDLDHRIDVYFQNGFSVGNRFEYSHKFKSFDKIQTYASYANDRFDASLIHSYQYEKLSEDKKRYTKDNYAILNASVNLPKYYKIFGRFEYDLTRSYSKMWRFGLSHNRKCWNYSFVYQEDIEPKNTSNTSYEKAKKERGFYFLVNFYPFGGVGYDFSVDSEYDTENKNGR